MTDTDTSYRCYNTAHHNRPTPTINTPRWVALHHKTKSAFTLILLRLAIFRTTTFFDIFQNRRAKSLNTSSGDSNQDSRSTGQNSSSKEKKAPNQHQNSIYCDVLTPQYKNTVYYCVFVYFDFRHLKECSFKRKNHL